MAQASAYEVGPISAKNCLHDIDGDNRVLATTDSVIDTRTALGITCPDVNDGITFAPDATQQHLAADPRLPIYPLRNASGAAVLAPRKRSGESLSIEIIT